MALCVKLNSKGVLTQSSETIDSCTAYVLVTHNEYDAGLLSNSFDAEAYDLAYGAVLQSLVIGLGIGWILAILTKLKR